MLNVKDRDIVLPGQLMGTNVRHDADFFRENGLIYSPVQGLVRVVDNSIRLIPLAGSYLPTVDDTIVGVISEVLTGRWIVDINTPYEGTLYGDEVTENPLHADLKKFFDIGNIISAKIVAVNEIYESIVARPWKLERGFVVEINPKRIPRIIGKKQSMLNMLREKTNSKIVVGQNGRVWVSGNNLDTVIRALKKIEREAHTGGLTDRIGEMLDNELKKSR